MMEIKIEQLTIPYDRDTLHRWKERDPNIVPFFMLNWSGPGISNGYGFGEWYAEQYFRSQGYYVLNNEFNLLSKNSKFKKFNDIIELFVGKTNIQVFKKEVQLLSGQGYTIENPDLFVCNLSTCFFAEVKKERDTLREPQLRFMNLASETLQTESKLVYLSDQHNEVTTLDVIFQIHETLEFIKEY